MEKLKEDLEVERARVRPTSPEVNSSSPSSAHERHLSLQKVHTLSSADHSVSDQAEIEEAVRTDKSDDAATKPASKRGPTIKAGLSNQFADNKTKGLKEQVARKRTGGRKPVLKPDSDIEEISDHAEKENEGGAAEATRKGKGKAKALEPDVIDDNDNLVEMKGKRKREAASDEESVQIVGVSKAKRGARAASKGPAAVGRGRSKPPSSRARSRQGSVMPVVEDDGVGEEAQPAVKKRKMLFPTEGKGATTILAGVCFFFLFLQPHHLIFALTNFCCLLVWRQRGGNPYAIVTGPTKRTRATTLDNGKPEQSETFPSTLGLNIQYTPITHAWRLVKPLPLDRLPQHATSQLPTFKFQKFQFQTCTLDYD